MSVNVSYVVTISSLTGYTGIQLLNYAEKIPNYEKYVEMCPSNLFL